MFFGLSFCDVFKVLGSTTAGVFIAIGIFLLLRALYFFILGAGNREALIGIRRDLSWGISSFVAAFLMFMLLRIFCP